VNYLTNPEKIEIKQETAAKGKKGIKTGKGKEKDKRRERKGKKRK